MSKGKNFRELSLKEYHKFSPLFTDDVYAITLESSAAARSIPGGTSPRQVEKALSRAKRLIRE
jgi:argininosuccinate lyase